MTLTGNDLRVSLATDSAGALASTAAGIALLILPGTAAWLGAIAVLGFGSSAISVGAAALTDRVAPAELGRRLGVYRLSGDLGLLAGPLANAFAY